MINRGAMKVNILKPLNKEFNALNTLESRRFVILQKKLGKAIRKTVGKSVQRNLQTKVEKNVVDIFELVELTREIVRLMDLAPAYAKAAAKGEKES
ncbi:hypothetical protein Tco_1041805 [Tanacetum coccineum]|uniref:Uncharacterized protein n=1 Tax=Tanacetum coccineum TaxID=301880 RepID=A0ABQ5GH70_9ASTR